MPDNNFSFKLPEGMKKALLSVSELFSGFQLDIKAALPGISNALSEFTKAVDTLRVYGLVLDKCKNNQWVICERIDYYTRELLVKDSSDVNAVMSNYYAENDYFRFKQLYNTHVTDTDLSTAHKLIVSEACEALLKLHRYNIVIHPLVAVFDGILSQFTRQQTTNFKKRLAKYNELTLDEMIAIEELQSPHDTYVWEIAHTFEAITSFTKDSFFSDSEPVELNRHWIVHGRSNRIYTEADCFKMFNLVFALMQLGDISEVEEGEKQ